MSQPDIAPSTGRPAKVLRFAQEDNDKLEGTALLTNMNTSDSPAHAPLVFGSMCASNVRTSEQQNERPPGLQEVPAAFTLWPGSSMSIVCPQCGNYVETILEDETECVGCSSLCSNGPLFRTIKGHYCPNCQNFLGIHYTGQTCGRGMGCCHVQ